MTKDFDWQIIFKNKIIPAFLLFLVAFIAYSNSLPSNFIDLDDISGIVKNPYLSDPSLRGIRQLFFPGLTVRQTTEFGYYPVINLMNMSCFALVRRFDPFFFHLMSVLMHSLTVIACFLTVSLICKRENIGFWTAFIFALHPGHTEAVNWISANCHLFVAFFGFLTVYFYIKKPSDKSKCMFFYFLSLSAFILLNLCKASLFTLPLLLLLYKYWIEKERFDLRNVSLANPAYSILPFFFVSAVFIVINLYLFPKFTSYVSVFKVFGWGIFYKFPALFLRYLGNALLPLDSDLAGVIYLPQHLDSFYFSMLMLTAVFIWLCYYLKTANHRLALFGIIAFAVLLLPGLAKIEVPTPLSLRLIYFPSFGLYLAVSLFIEQGLRKVGNKNIFLRSILMISCIFVFVAMASVTMNRNKHWYSADTLWSNLLKSYPSRMVGLFRLSLMESDPRKRAALIEEIDYISGPAAYGYPAFYGRMKAIVHKTLPRLYIDLNVGEEKMRGFYYSWYNLAPENAYPLWKLGSYYENKGLLKEAQGEYEKALRVYDQARELWLSLARIYEKQGFLDKAKETYREMDRRCPKK